MSHNLKQQQFREQCDWSSVVFSQAEEFAARLETEYLETARNLTDKVRQAREVEETERAEASRRPALDMSHLEKFCSNVGDTRDALAFTLRVVVEDGIQVVGFTEYPENIQRKKVPCNVDCTKYPTHEFSCRKGSWLFHLSLLRHHEHHLVVRCWKLWHMPTQTKFEIHQDLFVQKRTKYESVTDRELAATKMRALLQASDLGDFLERDRGYLRDFVDRLGERGYKATLQNAEKLFAFPCRNHWTPESIEYAVEMDEYKFSVKRIGSGDIRMVCAHEGELADQWWFRSQVNFNSEADMPHLLAHIDGYMLYLRGQYGVPLDDGHFLNDRTMVTWLTRFQNAFEQQYPFQSESKHGQPLVKQHFVDPVKELFGKIDIDIEFGGLAYARALVARRQGQDSGFAPGFERVKCEFNRFEYHKWVIRWELIGSQAKVNIGLDIFEFEPRVVDDSGDLAATRLARSESIDGTIWDSRTSHHKYLRHDAFAGTFGEAQQYLEKFILSLYAAYLMPLEAIARP
jgi:hypothetical protein